MYINKYASIEVVAVTSIYENQYREAVMKEGGGIYFNSYSCNFTKPPSTPTTMTHGPFFHPNFLRTKHEPLAMPKTCSNSSLFHFA
jgi:hypothetical protein